MIDRPPSRRAFIAAAAAGTSLLTTAGLLRALAPAGAQTAKRFKIALVPKGLDNPVFALANAGGQARATELGDVDFIFTGSIRSDAGAQVTAFENLVAGGYDAIGVSCCSAKALVKPIAHAVAKGIKVITWDSDSPKSKRSVCYGIDSFKGGQLQARLINDLLSGQKGDVWIVSGSPYAPNLEQRIGGVQKSISSNLNIAGTSFCDEDPVLAVAQLNDVLQAHPELIGLVLVGAWPLLAAPDLLPALRRKVKLGLQVVAFDTLEPELRFIADGTIKAAVSQDYWGWGYQSVQILHGLLTGKTYPAFVRQALPVVTAANVADYQRRWTLARSAGGAAQAFGEPPLAPPPPVLGRRHKA